MNPVQDLVLTEKQLQQIFRLLRTSSPPRRNRAIVQLFLHFGCTAHDICRLRIEDFDPEQGTLAWRVDEQPVVVPLPSELARDLRDYVRLERPRRTGFLFVTRLGHPLRTLEVNRIFRELGEEAGMPFLNPQSLRARHFRHALSAAPLHDLARHAREIPYRTYLQQ